MEMQLNSLKHQETLTQHCSITSKDN